MAEIILELCIFTEIKKDYSYIIELCGIIGGMIVN